MPIIIYYTDKNFDSIIFSKIMTINVIERTANVNLTLTESAITNNFIYYYQEDKLDFNVLVDELYDDIKDYSPLIKVFIKNKT